MIAALARDLLTGRGSGPLGSGQLVALGLGGGFAVALGLGGGFAVALSGALAVAAVLAHERAHARGRHDLVLLPFRALVLLSLARGPAGTAFTAVELLVEMCADDHARRGLCRAHGRPRYGAGPEQGDQRLAAALLRFSAAEPPDVPSGALAAAEAGTALRARRLLVPLPALPVRARCGAYALAGVLLVAPAALAWLPG